jgi:eukaryotic-like serine/threonine-protein kinase
MLYPDHLPAGTQVGNWRVLESAGRGMQGAVYRAERVGQEEQGPVTLKVALVAKDPRFAREAALLSRVSHPSVPRLYAQGEWEQAGGKSYPYLVMEWVEGTRLYEWARQHEPSAAQVATALAQVAGALRELHASGAVHRDVKGDNVLVRRGDGRAVLMDAGVGTYEGAERLTELPVPPGTQMYRSPELSLFVLRSGMSPKSRYEARPADDVYALGVMAYRVVVGEYPEPRRFKYKRDTWSVKNAVPTAPHRRKRGVEARLSALVLRMLAEHPEQRATAGELETALAQLAVSLETGRRGAAGRGWSGLRARPWGAALAAGVALAGWGWWVVEPAPEVLAVAGEETRSISLESGDTAGLGDAVAAASTADFPEPPAREVLAEEPLPELQPGQARPATDGRCPRKWQVALNGGCWGPLKLERDKCEEIRGQIFKGTCYVPIYPPARRPTSHPPGPR